MPRPLLSTVLAVSCLFVGCGKKSEPPAATPAATNTETSATAAAADMDAVLSELTQVLRKFSVEKQKVPGSLNELVAPGYLQNLPSPPPGKTFAIDTKNLKVILK